MKHPVRTLLTTIATVIAFAGSGHAQITGVTPKISPTLKLKPIVSVPRPVFMVTNGFVTPGTETPLKIRITGLNGASEAHIYALTMRGCTFHLNMAVSGQEMFYDGLTASGKQNTHRGALTSDGPNPKVGVSTGFRLDGTPDTPGKAVSSDGTVEFTAFGVAGVDMPDGVPVQTWEQRNVIFPTGNQMECSPTAIVAWKDKASGEWQTLASDGTIKPFLTAAQNGLTKELVSPMSYVLEKGSLKTISRTADLPFSPQAGGVGSCNGTSPGPKSYPVGVGTKDGDLTLTIRSGPGGTRCFFTLNHFNVNDGVEIEDVKWSVLKTGSACRIGQEAFLPSDVLGFANALSFQLNRSQGLFASPVVVRSGTMNFGHKGYWGHPYGGNGSPSQWMRFFPSMLATLECNPTLVNDNAITLRLDQITYRSIGSEPLR